MNEYIEIKFDGGIADKHQVSVRDLGRSLVHLQSAMDRAYLDVKHGKVWKHARLSGVKAFQETALIVGEPEKGSYLLKMFQSPDGKKGTIKRIAKALTAPFKAAQNEAAVLGYSLENQIANTRNALHHKQIAVRKFADLVKEPDEAIVRVYGDRSISKEVDQILIAVRKNPGVKLTLTFEEGGKSIFEFDAKTAAAFHRLVSHRALGGPVLYRGELRSLDRGPKQHRNYKGRFINADNGKTVTLHIFSQEDYDFLAPHIRTGDFDIIAAPIIEHDAFDPVGGDIQFLGLSKK
ncbi:hypothetical protein AB4120_18730 [Cupriavidus sp. 2KB_3]|uniref:hypothetical protein n=1 Tax=Cupriavidus sp. 2KB_3 TaxID=3232980 RepID=UPI003F8F538A